MHYYLICPIGVIGGKEDMLTYHSETPLVIGSVVHIPFGRQAKRGVVISPSKKPAFATKSITGQLPEIVPEHLLRLGQWMSEYYATRLSVVMQTILPSGIGKNRRDSVDLKPKFIRQETKNALTTEQKATVEGIQKSSHITHLLHGVTGSGKTRVYQELAAAQVKNGRSVIVLVPEIALTPQLAAEFESLFENVVVIHSGLTEAQRHKQWRQLQASDEPWIIIGPRSALFSPLTNIGLIVVDECHEPSYSQDSQPKYSALRVARKLAELSGDAKLVLGSATPLISDYFVAQHTGAPIYTLITPTQKRQTTIAIVDMKDREKFGNHPIFSKLLLEKMNNSIVQNEQILLFHNRRGTARMSLCSSCGWVAECPNCHLPIRLHHDYAELRCHVCGLTSKLPQICPTCCSPEVEFKGFGSKRIESEAQKLFPEASIARFDSDTPTKEQLHHRYQELYDGTVQIIIGTQGIAKGLDLPHLNTVGIVQADSELFIPDFSSSERAFQLTTQVIGRAGRTGAKSSVIIQTFNPEHPSLLLAAQQDYAALYEHEIAERSAEHMPPHTHLLHLTVGYASSGAAESAARKLKDQIKHAYPGVHVRGPSPAFHEHRGSQFYQQLIVGSATRSDLVAIARELPQRWQFTLDPLNLL